MDCSLSTWPSITQFDDLTWMGLGDIDPFETLDRSSDSHSQFTESSFTNPEETKPALPAARNSAHDTSAKLSLAKSDDFYWLTSCEWPAVTRWESIIAVDLVSVLDSFPSNSDPSTPGVEDVYDLYSESMIMQADLQLAGDVDAYMSNSMKDVHGSNNITHHSEDMSPTNDATVLSVDETSVSCTQEDIKCDISALEDESSLSANVNGAVCGQSSQVIPSNPMLLRADGSVQHVDNVDGIGSELRVNGVQPRGCCAFHPMQLSNCVDLGQGATNVRQSIAMSQHDAILPSMMIHWSKPHQDSNNPQLIRREQVVQQIPMRSYPAIIEQQLRMVDAARFTSEYKRNRAQASRARRLAATRRRAKKYPLQKLIRMSSLPASTLEKVDQNCMNPAAVPHGPMQPASQNQQSAAIHSSHLPVVLSDAQSSRLGSNHKLLTHVNPMQSTCVYHHHLSSAPDQNSLVSPSGSNALQAKHEEQHAQSSSALPCLATSQMFDTNESLDAVVLIQLQSLVSKMNVDTRFCIRDALDRLACSAKVRQSKFENLSGSGVDTCHSEVMETNTNSIDRWIVNMLFCKQPPSLDSTPQLPLLHTPMHTMESYKTNTRMQHWNSCGSFLNLQEQSLPVVSGL